MNPEILYEDNHLIAVNKPIGMLVQGDQTGDTPLVDHLKVYIKEKYNKANLHLSIDGSGSMSGKKFDRAMTSAVAICKAADMAGNIKVVVSFRYTQDKQPVVLIAYDSSKDKIQKIKSLWPALISGGSMRPTSLK